MEHDPQPHHPLPLPLPHPSHSIRRHGLINAAGQWHVTYHPCLLPGWLHDLYIYVNKWGRDKMDAIFATFSNAFPWMKMHEFRLRYHWSLFLRFELNNIPALVQATSHYLNQWRLVYWHIYASLGLNKWTHWGRNKRVTILQRTTLYYFTWIKSLLYNIFKYFQLRIQMGHEACYRSRHMITGLYLLDVTVALVWGFPL